MHTTIIAKATAIIAILIGLPVAYLAGWIPAWLAFGPHAVLIGFYVLVIWWHWRGWG